MRPIARARLLFVLLLAHGCTSAGMPTADARRAAPVEPHRPFAQPDSAPVSTLTFDGFGCPVDPDPPRSGYDRNSVHVSDALRMVTSDCNGERFNARVDEYGKVGVRRADSLWLPSSMGRVGRVSRLNSEAWVGVANDESDDVTPSGVFTFLSGEPHQWQVRARVERPRGDRLVGLGAWPGAVIATFRDRNATATPTLVVVHGMATAPLPTLPAGLGEHFALATTAEGAAFCAWNLDRPDGGLVVATWKVGSTAPEYVTFDGVEAWSNSPELVVRSATEVYLPVESGDHANRFIRVFRYDGVRWVTSLTVSGAESAASTTLTPDGAVWLVVEAEPWSEIWRRRPGSGDHWDQMVPNDLNRRQRLWATSIMPAGRSDALFGGRRWGVGHGLYRIHVASP